MLLFYIIISTSYRLADISGLWVAHPLSHAKRGLNHRSQRDIRFVFNLLPSLCIINVVSLSDVLFSVVHLILSPKNMEDCMGEPFNLLKCSYKATRPHLVLVNPEQDEIFMLEHQPSNILFHYSMYNADCSMWTMLLTINSRRPWGYFITMPGDSCTIINQMCWPVIIASALFQGSRDFTCELSLVGHRSRSPYVFWKTSEQKAERRFNWCVCGSRCTLLTSCKLVLGCNSRTKGLTHWYVRTNMISYCARNVWNGMAVQWISC